jgi:two-component system aerobic respiration control sensor histidine kinase ArcB
METLENTSLYYPNILAVEDVAIIQKLLSFYFKKMNCSFHIVGTGSETMKLIHAHQFDLIFMDLGLPDADGITLTETIRKMPQYQTTPIIAFSAHNDQEIRRNCFDNGFNEFLCKPVQQQQMCELVGKYYPSVLEHCQEKR